MNVRHRAPPRGRLSHHSTRVRQTTDRVFPPIRLRTNGQPISIVDGLVSATLLAAAFAVVGVLLGSDPRELASAPARSLRA